MDVNVYVCVDEWVRRGFLGGEERREDGERREKNQKVWRGKRIYSREKGTSD